MTAASDRFMASLLRRVRFPASVRTVRQRVLWLAKEGYVLTAYWLARMSNKVLVALLQRAHPNVPWKNIQFAAGPVRSR